MNPQIGSAFCFCGSLSKWLIFNFGSIVGSQCFGWRSGSWAPKDWLRPLWEIAGCEIMSVCARVRFLSDPTVYPGSGISGDPGHTQAQAAPVICVWPGPGCTQGSGSVRARWTGSWIYPGSKNSRDPTLREAPLEHPTKIDLPGPKRRERGPSRFWVT